MRTSVNYLLFLLICIFMSPLIVNADCDYQRISDLKKIASNVQLYYSYDLDTEGRPIFSVNVTNVTSDIYVVDMFGNEYRNFENNVPLNSIYYYIYSNDPNCPKLLLEKYFKLPYYNDFSTLDECKNNNSLLCDVWFDSSQYDVDTFRKLLNKNDDVRNNNSFLEDEEHYEMLYMLLVPIFLLILTFVYIGFRIHKRKKV